MGQAGGGEAARAAVAKSSVGDAGRCIVRCSDSYVVCSIVQRDITAAGIKLFAGIIPIAVGIPIDPGIENACAGRLNLNRKCCTWSNGSRPDDAVFIVAAAHVVAGCVAVWLAVFFRIQAAAEFNAANDDFVSSAIVGLKRGIRAVRSIAKIIKRAWWNWHIVFVIFGRRIVRCHHFYGYSFTGA